MNDLLARTQRFALAVLRTCQRLPKRADVAVIRSQLMRSPTSVGANCRASQRAKSRKDFLLKLSIVEGEADECCYWLELLQALDPPLGQDVSGLLCESRQLVSIIVACKKTARRSL